jgi:hypothetical protein
MNTHMKYVWKSVNSPTEGTGDGDRFRTHDNDSFVDESILFDIRDVVRRIDGRSYINKPEGNNDAPSCSADVRKHFDVRFV